MGVLQDQGEHLAGKGLAALGILSPLFRQVQDVPCQLAGTGPQVLRALTGVAVPFTLAYQSMRCWPGSCWGSAMRAAWAGLRCWAMMLLT